MYKQASIGWLWHQLWLTPPPGVLGWGQKVKFNYRHILKYFLMKLCIYNQHWRMHEIFNDFFVTDHQFIPQRVEIWDQRDKNRRFFKSKQKIFPRWCMVICLMHLSLPSPQPPITHQAAKGNTLEQLHLLPCSPAPHSSPLPYTLSFLPPCRLPFPPWPLQLLVHPTPSPSSPNPPHSCTSPTAPPSLSLTVWISNIWGLHSNLTSLNPSRCW